jgi:catechol 2,3-dioxygenase-like lactoylglutathione lyase family enzyme
MFKRPNGLNHVAYVTQDTAATRKFYTELLGLRLISYAADEKVGSTGEASPFLHTFFELGDGSCIAFFEIEGLNMDHHSSPLPRWAPHLALSLDSREDVLAALQRLVDAGVEVIGPIEHENIWSSIYFFDPNGVRLELTYQSRQLTDDDAIAADLAVEAWLMEHPQAVSLPA